MYIMTFSSKNIFSCSPLLHFLQMNLQPRSSNILRCYLSNLWLMFWADSSHVIIILRGAVIFYKTCSKDWKKLIARDGLQVNMRFLRPSDYILIQYSWGCDETFAHLIFWQSSQCIVDVSVKGEQSRVWGHESKFWERGSKTPGGLWCQYMKLICFSQSFFVIYSGFCLFSLSFNSGGILGDRC